MTPSLHDLTHGLPHLHTRDHLHVIEELINLINFVDCKLDSRMPQLNRLCYYCISL